MNRIDCRDRSRPTHAQICGCIDAGWRPISSPAQVEVTNRVRNKATTDGNHNRHANWQAKFDLIHSKHRTSTLSRSSLLFMLIVSQTAAQRTSILESFELATKSGLNELADEKASKQAELQGSKSVSPSMGVASLAARRHWANGKRKQAYPLGRKAASR